MNNYEKVTGLVGLEELSMESGELDNNGGITPTFIWLSGAVASAIVSAVLPTTVCSSKC